MLLDANILLYAVDSTSPFHGRTRHWLESHLNGASRVGLPWLSLTAFIRISTNPRALREPLSIRQAWSFVEDWLAAAATWIPAPGRGHQQILGRLLADLDLRANLGTDAVLAALCIEHGLQIVSADSDFARFDEITWINPLRD